MDGDMDMKTDPKQAAVTPLLVCGLALDTVGLMLKSLGSWHLLIVGAGLILIVSALAVRVRAEAKSSSAGSRGSKQ
jgi:glucose dehydrogenase